MSILSHNLSNYIEASILIVPTSNQLQVIEVSSVMTRKIIKIVHHYVNLNIPKSYLNVFSHYLVHCLFNHFDFFNYPFILLLVPR